MSQQSRAAVRRPTLEQVAARAGVSRATVSRVVNGWTTVDPKLVEVVQGAVAELGYVPNLAARSLMTQRTDTLALVAAEPDTRVFSDPFFSGITRGITHELASAGMTLMLHMAQSTEDMARIEQYLLGDHVDGVLLISEHLQQGLAKTLHSADIPLVIGGRPLDPDVEVPYVDHDNTGGGALAARHLLGLGRRTIGTVTGPLDMSAGVDRLRGFAEGMGEQFRTDLVETGDFTTDGGANAMGRLLARAPHLDAVFVASDLMALGAINVARRAGRRVPDDLAVVGFDDIDIAAVSVPGLSTVRQRPIDQGRMMVRLLFAQIHRTTKAPDDGLPEVDGASRIVLPVELVLRESG